MGGVEVLCVVMFLVIFSFLWMVMMFVDCVLFKWSFGEVMVVVFFVLMFWFVVFCFLLGFCMYVVMFVV